MGSAEPSERLARARRGWAAWEAGDQDVILSLLAPDIRWEPQFPTAEDVYHGREGVRLFWSEWLGQFADFEARLEELRERGDRILCIAWHRGRGGTSGVDVEMRYGMIFDYGPGDLVTRARIYPTVEEAEAALAEGPG